MRSKYGWLLFCLGMSAFVASPAWCATNRVLSLNGTTDCVSVPHNVSMDLTNCYTLEAWVSVSDTNKPPLVRGVVNKMTDDPYGGITLGIVGNRADFGFYAGGSITYGVPGTSTLQLHAWTHLCATFDGTNVTLYVNGTPEGTSVCPRMPHSSRPLEIGRVNYQDRYFAGMIDEVRVWNRARTQTEIQSSMYTRMSGVEPGLVGYWTFDDGTAGDSSANHNDGSFIGGATTMPEGAVTNDIHWAVEIPFNSDSPLTQYQLQYSTNLLSTNWFNVADPIRGNGTERSLFDGPRGASPRFYRVVNVYENPFVSVAEGLVAYYPFNGNADDVSGNGNTGTVQGATLTTDRYGDAGKAYAFDGTDDYINCGQLLNRYDVFSFSVWFARTNLSSKTEDVIIKRRLANADGADIWMSNNDIFGTINREPAIAGQYIIVGKQVDTAWHHVALTCDGANLRIYCDGVSVTNRPIPVGAAYSSEDLWIGRGYASSPDAYGVRAFSGLIDEVRIYNRALSSNEVLRLYNTP